MLVLATDKVAQFFDLNIGEDPLLDIEINANLKEILPNSLHIPGMDTAGTAAALLFPPVMAARTVEAGGDLIETAQDRLRGELEKIGLGGSDGGGTTVISDRDKDAADLSVSIDIKLRDIMIGALTAGYLMDKAAGPAGAMGAQIGAALAVTDQVYGDRG